MKQCRTPTSQSKPSFCKLVDSPRTDEHRMTNRTICLCCTNHHPRRYAQRACRSSCAIAERRACLVVKIGRCW